MVGDPVRIGYSFWGFLGPGITDTPDGGRSHRRTLIDGLIAGRHQIVFLQANRDLDEAGHDLTGRHTWDDGLPGIDALFLEWRWPIPGRNTTGCGTAGHTCDLHRQRQLLAHYTCDQSATGWPHVSFTGRCPFTGVGPLYRSALATVLLLPGRYARAGQMTQRIFEAVLAGCLPITPAHTAYAGRFTPAALHARNGRQVIDRITEAQAIAGSARHAQLLAACITRLGIFRVSRQIDVLNRIFERLADAPSARLPHTPAASR